MTHTLPDLPLPPRRQGRCASTSQTLPQHVLFPNTASLRWRKIHLSPDVRKAGESLLIISVFILSMYRLACTPQTGIIIELSTLMVLSLLYIFASQYFSVKPTSPAVPLSPASFRKHSAVPTAPGPTSDSKSLLWMTSEKNYRDTLDDGVLTALLFAPMITATMLYSISTYNNETHNLLPPAWLIEEPAVLSKSILGARQALMESRKNLVQLSTLCSTILLVHVFASLFATHRESVDNWIPKSEMTRSGRYTRFAFMVAAAGVIVRFLFTEGGIPIWQDLSYFDVAVIALCYQFTLYVMVRLARSGFTLGELGLVAQGATALFMETLNLTIARIWPLTTPFIKVYRLPTPLLIYQIALIPGAFLTGFLLSPLLVLSRHISSRPIRRLKFPDQKVFHRQALAGGFYVGTAIIVGGLIGTWARWCLSGRNPWLWVILWLMEGSYKWSRPVLLAYWGILSAFSVAGWNRQLARARRYRTLPPTEANGVAEATTTGNGVAAPVTSHGLATDLLDAADKQLPLLGLNGRRKFFHALAVFMFIPGIVFDPAFTHFAFSAAFALFIFAEYVRYFALYPFGAAVHLFLNEFLDHKDSGTAILSHFYLLTGCAGSLWLEPPYRTPEYTGVLVLGVGDALASIIGKRFGKWRWSHTSAKTIEGSAAFVVSVLASAWLLRLFGAIEAFSTARYVIAVMMASVLEALSVQNDNLTLPLYMWTVLILLDVVPH